MLKRFAAALLGAPSHGQRHDSIGRQLATCVLLVEAAYADEAFTEEEYQQIREVMQRRFGLEPGEAESLIEDALQSRERSTDLFRFTRAINEHFGPEEKQSIVEEVWRVLYNDGVLTGHEDHLVHKMASLLNLDHNVLIAAKLRAKQQQQQQQ